MEKEEEEFKLNEKPMRVRRTRDRRWRKPMKALWPFRGFWGVSGEVRFEIMDRGEAELNDDGFDSPMSDEALTATISDKLNKCGLKLHRSVVLVR
ncbi:hypothetical protein V6N11_055168 [Hibiscus sabdariffa]|uniref:Uncharacterized protein n=2 Tax=Hibiscus sabdariffa TaxID=183260 RepID=A0ABR2C060_9ROSI